MNVAYSRRERQIMDEIYRHGGATATEIHQSLPDAPTYSAVRGLLRILEAKGAIRHQKSGRQYRYSPVVSRKTASLAAVRHLLHTWFSGSTEQAVAAIVSARDTGLSQAEYRRLLAIIRVAAPGRARDDR